MRKVLFILLAAFVCLSVSGKAQNAQLADTLYVKGNSYMSKGNYKEAEFYYKEAFSMYKQLQDTSEWLKAGRQYAEALYYRSRYDEASTLFSRLLSTRHPENDNSFKARIHSTLGLINNRRDNNDLALSHYKTGLDFAQKAKDSLMIGVLYNNLGYGTSDEEAMDYFKKALPYFETLDNKRSLAVTLANIGRICEKCSGASICVPVCSFTRNSSRLNPCSSRLNFCSRKNCCSPKKVGKSPRYSQNA